ncbi:uncharacterized protein LOC135818473 [Sycon ciliatum]|uniref:uncharacterized protein LOC135818473 n=1 Tax=Sycon ciliatum TaxID=27933 RepID=UPI0031F6D5D0
MEFLSTLVAPDVTDTPSHTHATGQDSWAQLVLQNIKRGGLTLFHKLAGSCVVRPQFVAKDALRHGDHVMMPKRLFRVNNIPEHLKKTYRYFHHGVYIKDESGEYVVGFTSPDQEMKDTATGKRQQAEAEDSSSALTNTGHVAKTGHVANTGHVSSTDGVDEVDGYLIPEVFLDYADRVQRRSRHAILGMFTNLITDMVCHNRIVKEDLASYEYEGRYIRYAGYQDDPDRTPMANPGLQSYQGVESSVDEAPRHVRAEVAKFFMRNPQAFGEYNLMEWNCEHFVSFCFSTSMTALDLERALEELPPSDVGRFDRDFLNDHSRTASPGLDFYFQAGLPVFFLEIDDKDKCRPRRRCHKRRSITGDWDVSAGEEGGIIPASSLRQDDETRSPPIMARRKRTKRGRRALKFRRGRSFSAFVESISSSRSELNLTLSRLQDSGVYLRTMHRGSDDASMTTSPTQMTFSRSSSSSGSTTTSSSSPSTATSSENESAVEELELYVDSEFSDNSLRFTSSGESTLVLSTGSHVSLAKSLASPWGDAGCNTGASPRLKRKFLGRPRQ